MGYGDDGQHSTGTSGVSEALRAFTEELPYERRSILAFVEGVASGLPPRARVLDVGAGDAPYRELFDHVEYLTVDWDKSTHDGAARSDVVASAEAIPLDGGTFDAVLLTQVLEHIREPLAVLREAHRLLTPGGGVHLTAPLLWELHELPFDYFRFTAPGVEHLLAEAGFMHIEVSPRTDCFTTVAQLMRNAATAMGRAPDGLDEKREQAAAALWRLAGEVAGLRELDVAWTMPLGYQASATKAPATGA